nr:proline dehydrogenase family protein [Paenibacillus guangzhouensis]
MELQASAAQALKSIARNEQMKSYIQESKDLYPLLARAARRYVAGETRDEAIAEAMELTARGYVTSLEYIGENTRDQAGCEAAHHEFLQLIHTANQAGIQHTISLDLSHIGMVVDAELAYKHLAALAREAGLHGMKVMISAEESAKTDQILAIYRRACEDYANVGITLQAQLHRTERDVEEVLACRGPIRLVKGAYQESPDLALPRSEALNARYLGLADRLIASGRSVSIATHDEVLHQAIRQRGYLQHSNVEIEMLYGIRPDLLKRLRDEGHRVKVYVLYGREWFLYFCHRLSEYPPNLYQAIVDVVMPRDSKEIGY